MTSASRRPTPETGASNRRATRARRTPRANPANSHFSRLSRWARRPRRAPHPGDGLASSASWRPTSLRPAASSLAILIAACSSTAPAPAARPQPTPSTSPGRPSDWTEPAIAESPRFVPPVARAFTLANGIHVVAIENHRLPIVAFELIARGAGSRDEGDKHGLAALTADVLEKGTELATRVDALAANLDVHVAADYATVAMTAPADRLADDAALLARVVRAPDFDELDVERARETRVGELGRARDQATTAAAQLFDRVVFGEHPYARSSEGEPVSVARLVPADVRAFWKRAYAPASTTIVVAGDVTEATLAPALTAAFGDWSVVTPEPARTPLVAGYVTRQLAYIDRPGAQTATLLVGKRGFAAGDVRQLAADVVATVVGGSEHSRLTSRLRDELGYTHGVGTGFWRGQWGGTWSVSTTVKASVVGAVVTEIIGALDSARAKDVTADELAQAKAVIAHSFAQSFETVEGTARAFARLVVHGQTVDSYADYLERLDHVTTTTARSAIDKVWADPTIVVVGDWNVIGPQLASFGLTAKRYEP